MTDDLAMMPASELAVRYRRKDLSPVEVTKAVLARIDALNPRLNAFCHCDDDSALAAAADSEARWARGEPVGLVDGVPATVKDLVVARGWPTLRGSLTVASEGPWDEDAPSVARLRAQGAVLLGKTATPEFGWKGITDSPLTGITRNPWNPVLTPGGSSGGATAAAATGMGALHIGTDGGGSIRIPAAFTGVFGIKPTFGRVAAYPQSPLGTISHLGPIARTVADAALMLTVIAGSDARDWLSLPEDRRDYRVGLEAGISGLRIAYSRTLGFAEADADVIALVDRAVETLADLGAHIQEADPQIGNPRDAFEAHFFGHYAAIGETMTEQQRERLDPGLRAMMAAGRRFGPIDWLQAELRREEIARALGLFLADYDLLVSPQMPIVAFEAGADVPAGRGMTGWLDWSPYTYPFNLSQQPAASVPCGLNEAGLPAALQIVGPRFAEALVLRTARAYESVHPFAMPEAAGGAD